MEITGKKGPEGVVKAVCTSEKKGVEKHSVPEGHFLKDFGIEGDAHAGKWHRQVSLLSYDKVKEFNERGAQVEDGALLPAIAGGSFVNGPRKTNATCGVACFSSGTITYLILLPTSLRLPGCLLLCSA